MAPEAVAADVEAGAAAAHSPPWLITSEHLDPDLPQTKQLHLVVLNWHLPVLTARLWGQGEQHRVRQPAATSSTHLRDHLVLHDCALAT